VVGGFLRNFLPRRPLAQTTIALFELPMAYPSVRWRQTLPPEDAEDEARARERREWLARTAILLIEEQTPLLTRELQGRVMTRLDEFVDYRMTWDKFAQQAPPREEGGLLLAELDATIVPGRPPQLRSRLRQRVTGRSVFTILATLLDGFTADAIRAMPSSTQGWACLWLTYLIRWYTAEGPAGLKGRASRHPRFFEPGGVPDEADFPRGEAE
jgi:hypothetical protein